MRAPITALYAGLLGFLVIVLATRVVLARRTSEVGLGDGGDDDLLRRIRVHGNAVENIPIGLLLILILELNGGSSGLLHGLGASLTAARVAHAQGLTSSAGASPGRLIGTTLTWITIAVASVAAILSFMR
jgi:uncharacterized protein